MILDGVYMKRITVGYCSNCRSYRKHRVIKCKDDALYRTLETVITFGLALLFEHDYYCECEKCGKINILSV